MKFDLRLPIGLMFGFYGVVLIVYGLLTTGSVAYERSLDFNVNLIWGAVLLAFGSTMLAGALRTKQAASIKTSASCGSPSGSRTATPLTNVASKTQKIPVGHVGAAEREEKIAVFALHKAGPSNAAAK